MYSISERYKNAIKNSNPSYIIGTITFPDSSVREFDSKDIVLGGLSITMQAVTQDVLEFGAAILGQMDISLRTPAVESRYRYYGAIIDLDYNIETEDGVETIPLGVWHVTEAERAKTALKLCAYDNLFKMDTDYTVSLVGTPYDIMCILADDCGCLLAENENYYKSLPNGEQVLSVNAGGACNTYRQAAAIVAQMCGCFVQSDREGKISLKRFSTTETFSISPSQRYKCVLADYVCEYVDLVVTGLAGTFRSVSETVETGMTMYIDDAPAWDEGLEEVLQEKADNLMKYIETIKYTPGELLIPSDPSIDCGDLVTVETENGTSQTLITSYTWKFHNQMEIQSVGKNPYLITTNANKQRVLRDIEMGGGTNPSVLHTFKNINKFKCTQVLSPIAEITFAATKDTFVLFNGTFQVDVVVDDIECISQLVIKDTSTETGSTGSTGTGSTGSTETPVTYEVPYLRDGIVNIVIQYYYNAIPFGDPYNLTLRKGSNIVTLHYPISSVAKDSINRFSVYMSSDDGEVVIPREMFIGTISGQGLVSKIRWDGTININEYVPTFTFNPAEFTVEPAVDTPSFSSQVPRPTVISEAVSSFEIDNDMTWGNVSAEPDVARVMLAYVIETAEQAKYTFDRNYVAYDRDVFELNTSYTYSSVEESIDSGKLCSVTIRNNDKVSISDVNLV